MTQRSDRAAGIACGIGAGALWGLVFLVPEVARDFGALHLAAGRYIAYGVIACALLAPRWKRILPHLALRDCWILLALGMLGNTLYYVLLVSAVQLAGIALTSLVIGFIPVVVTLVGSRDKAAPSLAGLAPSLLLGTAAALCIGWQAARGSAAGGEAAGQLAGLLCAAGALASWAGFAVANSRCLSRLVAISAHDWSLLLGLATGAQALLLVPVALALEPQGHDGMAWTRFAALSFGVAVFASIVGNALWNRMCRLLPLTMVGQMILFETLFALLYAFLWEQRLPTGAEVLAIVLVISSVLSCLSVHRSPGAKDSAGPSTPEKQSARARRSGGETCKEAS
jgi:drug/metabolite transporter (DMT)-like permease